MELSLRARVRAGDPDAFGLLFDAYARAVYNHAFRLTGDWSAAEEAVSLTFLEAWRLRDRVAPEGDSLRPWLLGIALNVTRNMARAARRHRSAVGRLPPPPPVPDFADELAGRIDDAGRLRLVHAALAAAVAATVVAVSPPGGRDGHHAAGGPPARATAAQLLSKIAVVASHQPVPRVHAGQYEYIASEVTSSAVTARPEPAGGPQARPRADRPHSRQIWLSVSGVCSRGLLNEPAAGLHDMVLSDQDLHGTCTVRPGFGNPAYKWLASLPASPEALLSLLRDYTGKFGTEQDQEMFTVIGDLLNEAIVPPALSAGLYRAAALIPGVFEVPKATDVAGRPGVAVAFRDRGGGLTEWIFNRTSLAWLGSRYVTSSGTTSLGTAVMQRAFVDHPGQLPAHH